MRPVLIVGASVAACLVGAVFVGVAAANTGAPVFYDARYPASASPDPDQYEAGSAVPDERSGDATGDAARDTTPEPAPDAALPLPPASEPPAATPTPVHSPKSAPSPDADLPIAQRPAPGGPPAMPGPDNPPPNKVAKEAWLDFQQIVRECMNGAGQEYLYWEWWKPGPDQSNRFPAMPPDLSPEEYAAWDAALHGDPHGDAYSWEEAGCWGYAVHATGGAP